MKILSFTKIQFFWVIFTLVVIMLATTLNLAASKRRSRDAQRKADLRSVMVALERFRSDFDSYPLSSDGQILACGVPQVKNGQYYFDKCVWGQDKLGNFTLQNSVYIDKLPAEPHQVQGARYIYISNGKQFSLYTSLESTADEDYNKQVSNLGIWCGNVICNYELTSGNN